LAVFYFRLWRCCSLLFSVHEP